MTELQFLIDLLLNHKLSEPTKKLVAQRIGEVEEQLRGPKPITQLPHRVNPTTIQSASTQAIIDREAAPPIPMSAMIAPQARGMVPPDIMVSTGSNIKGKRKF